MTRPRIGLIGFGNMGSALVDGWLTSKAARPGEIRIYDSDLEKLREAAKRFGIKAAKDNRDIVSNADVVLFAVKPQVLDEVLQEISSVAGDKTLFISIAAGVPLDRIEKNLGKGVGVVRVMPNAPALIREGISALCANKQVTKEGRKTAGRLLDAVGETVWIKEEMMDAVTGLSGSGPAYIFVLIEALSDAGVRQGLSREVATRLALWTVRGAAGMALESERHPGELKDLVTSPGGTTIAGLHALEKGKFRASLYNAVAAATERSKELGRGK
jgi:pyrroline-5-carboxylate reductase